MKENKEDTSSKLDKMFKKISGNLDRLKREFRGEKAPSPEKGIPKETEEIVEIFKEKTKEKIPSPPKLPPIPKETEEIVKIVKAKTKEKIPSFPKLPIPKKPEEIIKKVKAKTKEKVVKRPSKIDEKIKEQVDERIDEFTVGIKGRINKVENELRRSLNEMRGEIGRVHFGDLDKLINETILTLDTRVKKNENSVNNFKAEINDRFDSLGKEIESLKSRQPEDQRYFEMMFSAKLKEANENIIRHLKETQDRVNTALFEHNENIKHFKEHITNFINESMVNYERRFELLQRNIDEKLKKIQSSGSAIIVE